MSETLLGLKFIEDEPHISALYHLQSLPEHLGRWISNLTSMLKERAQQGLVAHDLNVSGAGSDVSL